MRRLPLAAPVAGACGAPDFSNAYETFAPGAHARTGGIERFPDLVMKPSTEGTVMVYVNQAAAVGCLDLQDYVSGDDLAAFAVCAAAQDGCSA